MSGISSIGSSPSSAYSSSLGSSSLPNGGLSAVGESLLTTGQAPNPVTSTSTAAPTNSAGLTSYQSEFLNLQAYDDQELEYASQLSFSAGLQNADSVFLQAAALLGTPGSQNSLSSGLQSTLSTGQPPAVRRARPPRRPRRARTHRRRRRRAICRTSRRWPRSWRQATTRRSKRSTPTPTRRSVRRSSTTKPDAFARAPSAR